MLHFTIGSQAYTLVTLLTVCGEYPLQSLQILGNERTLKKTIDKMLQPQKINGCQTELTCRILSLSGKGEYKSLRLYKAFNPILRNMGADAYYLDAFWGGKFPGDMFHKDRNFRVAESIAMCMMAGYEFRPYVLPKLSDTEIKVRLDQSAFYPSKELKRINQSEIKKTIFSRLTGALFVNDEVYAVYNTRNAVMKWNGMSEFKTLHNLIEIGRLNTVASDVDSAILFCWSDSVAIATINETEKNRRLEFRFDSVYQHIHCLSMDRYGIRQLKFFSVPKWKERILEALFESETRSYDMGLFEYDALVDDTYIFSFLDSDIARLLRLKYSLGKSNPKLEILCFPHQLNIVSACLGKAAELKTIELSEIESALGLRGQDEEEN